MCVVLISCNDGTCGMLRVISSETRQTMGTNNVKTQHTHTHTKQIGPSEKGANWKRIFVLNFHQTIIFL